MNWRDRLNILFFFFSIIPLHLKTSPSSVASPARTHITEQVEIWVDLNWVEVIS